MKPCIKLPIAVIVLTSSLMLSGCGEKEKTTANYDIVTGEATGCLQGVIYDGVNRSRVPLDGIDMYLVTRNRIIAGLQSAADLPGADESRLTALEGEYVLCDVPFGGQTVPLYLTNEGYQDYTQLITLPTDTPNRGSSSTTPGYWVWPTMMNDITLYKLSDLVANDYTVKVYRAGTAVEAAKVMLVPSNVRMATQTAATDSSGLATFTAADLAFGQAYSLKIYDPAPDSATSGHVATYGTIGNVTIGSMQTVTSPIVATSVFSITVDLSLSNPGPVLVTSTKTGTVSSTGAVTFTFDRNIKANFDSMTSVTVSITDYGTKSNGTACTTTDLGEVINAALQIKVTDSGNTSTVTPYWSTAPTTTGCRGVQLTYTWGSFGYTSADSAVATTTAIGGSLAIYLTSPGQ